MQLQLFDRSMLDIKPLSYRKNDLDISIIKHIDEQGSVNIDKRFEKIAKHIIHAKQNMSPIILMIGGHVIRAGVQNYLINLMERGYISCIATNGSVMIHDFELALIGATTECVADYIREGLGNGKLR